MHAPGRHNAARKAGVPGENEKDDDLSSIIEGILSNAELGTGLFDNPVVNTWHTAGNQRGTNESQNRVNYIKAVMDNQIQEEVMSKRNQSGGKRKRCRKKRKSRRRKSGKKKRKRRTRRRRQ